MDNAPPAASPAPAKAATPSTILRSTAPSQPYCEDHVLKVGSGTPCKKLAKAIIGVLDREKRCPVLEYVGAGPGQQAVKAVAIAAQEIFNSSGRYIAAIPVFVHCTFEDTNDMTGMQLRIVLL